MDAPQTNFARVWLKDQLTEPARSSLLDAGCGEIDKSAFTFLASLRSGEAAIAERFEKPRFGGAPSPKPSQAISLAKELVRVLGRLRDSDRPHPCRINNLARLQPYKSLKPHKTR